jgi:hypothetical protein
MIYGTQLVAAAHHPRPINPPESNIMKLVKSSVNVYSVKFSNIKKSVCCLNFLFERMQTFINEKSINAS